MAGIAALRTRRRTKEAYSNPGLEREWQISVEIKAVSVWPQSCSGDEHDRGPLWDFTNEASDLTIRFVQALPDTFVHRRIGGQLLDSGTSQAANYSAARRARSPADFVAKMKIVEEEADESLHWLDKLQKAGIPHTQYPDLIRLRELFNQIVPLAVSSIKTTRSRHLNRRRRS